MASTPYLTPYKKKHGAAGGGDVAMFSSNFDMSPVPNALITPFIQQRKEEINTQLGSKASGVPFFSPVSSKPSDQRREITSKGAFDEASAQSYSLDGTCQLSAIFQNHLAIAFRSSVGEGIIEFRLFKEDRCNTSTLHPTHRRVTCPGAIVDFFFLTFYNLDACECRVIVASDKVLSCYGINNNGGAAQSDAVHTKLEYSFKDDERIARILSCDGVCVQEACYIAVSALLRDTSCVIIVLKLVPQAQDQQWSIIKEIPIASTSAILRWRKLPVGHPEMIQQLWFVCGDNDGFATLFECIFNSQNITSITAVDAYPISSLPITSVSVSDSLAAIVTNGSCALLSFDTVSSTLRPMKGLADAFLPAPAEKSSKILAASVSPDNDCVAVFRCTAASPAVSLEVFFNLGSFPLPSFKYGLQPHHRRFSGSATSLSWRCTSDGNVIAACTARPCFCAPFLFLIIFL